MAANLILGFELIARIRQLLKDPIPENKQKILENCGHLETFVRTESEPVKIAEAGASCTKSQERLEKLSQRRTKLSKSFPSIKRTHDAHASYIASLSQRILALNQEDNQSRLGPDRCRQFKRLYLIYQLSTGTAALLPMRKKYMRAKKGLEKLESRLERVNKACEEQEMAMEKVCDEWKRLGVESDAVLAEVEAWWEGLTGEKVFLGVYDSTENVEGLKKLVLVDVNSHLL
jgi:chromosome segregation ATPase